MYVQCVKDFGLHNQNIIIEILFACLVGWLDSSPVEIPKKLGIIFKYRHGPMHGLRKHTHLQLHKQVRLRGPQSLAHCVGSLGSLGLKFVLNLSGLFWP